MQIVLVIFILVVITIKIIIKFTNGICKSNVCLVGKTALVTGGNKGIGYHTALGLAARGCRVIIASRTSSENVKNEIIKHTNNPNIIAKSLDLGSLDSVRKFAEEFNKTEKRLDILINNAGISDAGNIYTKDGLQLGMQVNHFGHFLLTHLLVNLLKKSAPSRIIHVSSWMAFVHNLKNLELLNSPFNGWKYTDKIPIILLYANSKLCNIITSNGFAEKLKIFGVTSNSLNPGNVNTEIFGNMFTYINIPNILISLFYFLLRALFKSQFEGAQTTLRLAVSNKLEKDTGKYYWDCVPFFVPTRAKDVEFCKEVWEESEKLVGLKPNEKL